MAPARQERAENIARMRRQQILDAALSVFSEKGFDTATTAEIARTAGVAEGTIYNYFKSKRELFIAAIENLIITVPLLDLIEKLPNGDIGVAFKHILQNRFKLIESRPMSQMPAMMAEIQRDPELKALWAEKFLQPFLSQLDGMYRIMTESGKFRRMEPAVAVRAVGGLILGFLMLKVMEGDASSLDRMPQEKVAEEMVQFALHGLLNDKEEDKR